MKKALILAVLLTLSVFLTGCNFGNGDIETTSTNLTDKTSTDKPEDINQSVTKRFTITGFTWSSCAQTAKGALSSLDGVKSVTVETSGDTVITYDPNIASMEKIRDTLKKLNYDIKNEQ